MKMLLADETLFRNPEVFEIDYIPEDFMFRDNEMRTLSFCLKPALSKQRPLNALLFGKPATGKTTSIRKVFEEFSSKSEKAVFTHINCKVYDTEFKIFSLIHKNVVGYEPPETGVPFSTVYDNIFKTMEKNKRSLVVALDDVIFSNHINEILYKILRAHELYNVKTAVFLVSMNDIMHLLDEKVRSVFHPERIEYKEYTKKEMLLILKNRVELGLYDDVMDEKQLRKIVIASQDVRHGIELIKKSALLAELDASRKILAKHIEKAIADLNPNKPMLKNDESLVLNCIQKPIESGLLFKSINKKTQMNYTKFYRILKTLQQKRLINIKTINKKKGRTSIISRQQ